MSILANSVTPDKLLDCHFSVSLTNSKENTTVSGVPDTSPSESRQPGCLFALLSLEESVADSRRRSLVLPQFYSPCHSARRSAGQLSICFLQAELRKYRGADAWCAPPAVGCHSLIRWLRVHDSVPVVFVSNQIVRAFSKESFSLSIL